MIQYCLLVYAFHVYKFLQFFNLYSKSEKILAGMLFVVTLLKYLVTNKINPALLLNLNVSGFFSGFQPYV